MPVASHTAAFSTSISLLLFLSFHPFSLSLLLFSLLFPHTHFQFFHKTQSFSSLPHLHLILLCYHTVNSARAPFMPFHFPSPTPSDKNQFLWQELWQQISITLITNCTVEIEKRSKIREKTHQIAEARRVCNYHRGQRSISLQPVVQPECSGGSLCKLEGGCPNLCLFFLLSRTSVWNHPGES